jgi:outer membrane protein assembly factor BamB
MHPYNTLPRRVALSLALALVWMSVAPAGADWPVFHGDSRRSGLTLNDAPFDSNLAWSYLAADSIVYSSPVVAPDGTIYVGTLGEDLLALDPEGGLIWSYQGQSNFRHASPAIGADGTVYIGGADGVLHAVWPDGSPRWTFQADAAIKTSANVALDGTIYFGADDGKLYAVDSDGGFDWSFPTGAAIRSSPAIAPDGTILFGSLDHEFYALWPNGSLRWSATTGDIIKYAAPAVTSEGVVYFGSYDGFVYAVTVEGTFLWAFPVENAVRTTPALWSEGIFVGVGNELYAIRDDGSLAWDYTTGGTIYSSPVYFETDGVVCFGSTDGVFYCLHDDGGTDWTYTVGPEIRSAPAPGSFGQIYVPDVSGTFWSFGNPPGVSVEETIGFGGFDILVAPNPTSDTVVFRLIGGETRGRRVLVHNLRGQRVAELQMDSAGQVRWDTQDSHGVPLPAGVYLYRYEGSRTVGRITLVR